MTSVAFADEVKDFNICTILMPAGWKVHDQGATAVIVGSADEKLLITAMALPMNAKDHTGDFAKDMLKQYKGVNFAEKAGYYSFDAQQGNFPMHFTIWAFTDGITTCIMELGDRNDATLAKVAESITFKEQ